MTSTKFGSILAGGAPMRQRPGNVSGSPTAPGKFLHCADADPCLAATAHVLLAAPDTPAGCGREAQLRAAGVRVSIARTIFATLVKASCFVPDLILLDSAFGGAASTEAARLLTTCPLTAHIPVIRLSARPRVPLRLLAELRRRPASL